MSAQEGSVQLSVTAFLRARPRYEQFARYVNGLVAAHCGEELIHTTEFRAKTPESFERKCRKPNTDGGLRYSEPLVQITDLSGVRVIVFVRDSVDAVCEKIRSLFTIIEIEDVGERVYSQGRFGYQSKHLLIKLGPDRQALVENKDFRDIVCEIQVRTILQHAWAEMEHDIQYKADQEIPVDLKKRFSALAGLLELADREFQSIQRDSEALRDTVKAELINDLTQQSFSEKQTGTSKAGANSGESVAARELVSKGDYEEAIKIYASKIALEPESYTLYLGRAKSHFLAGDVRAAIADLDKADSITNDKNKTALLRALIERGETPREATRGVRPEEVSRGVNRAQEALRSGDGIAAFEEYSNLQKNGYNAAFALFGKAMSCVLERDTVGAQNLLQSFALRAATPMAVNMCALRSIIAILDGVDVTPSQTAMHEALENLPTFSLAFSPLRFLISGISAKGFDELTTIQQVLARLPQG